MKISLIQILLASLLALCSPQVSQNPKRQQFSCSPEACIPTYTGLIKSTTVINDPRSMKLARKQRKTNYGCYSILNMFFRTPDGSCNNLRNNFGSSEIELARLLPAVYSDSNFAPRKFSTVDPSKELPSARDVSRAVHPDKTATSELTIMMMQWGQFIDHELVSTPLPIEDTRGLQQCCGDNMSPPSGEPENKECFPIVFGDSNDPDFDGSCMEFLRSQPAMDDNGNMITPRENRNSVTSFLDASTVYGSTEERFELVRDQSNRHLLRTTEDNFPPDNGLNDCVKRDDNDICHLAGDERANEQPALTLTHVMFMRLHNVYATQIRNALRDISDETVFRLARATVEAVQQKITYDDWLAILLGSSVREEFRLRLDRRTRYSLRVDPRIMTEFSTAAFRIGHTLIPRSLPLTSSRRVALRELFFHPFETRENMDSLAKGILTAINDEDRMQPSDNFIVSEVTSHLFENQEGDRKGFDLAALNIQRGRDHGIPPFNDVRAKLGLDRVTSFSDSVFGDNGPRLAQVYDHVDDMDLFPAGLSEELFNDGLAGVTFSRLIALQFQRLREGDRFFFDINPVFQKSGVQQIRGTTLAHVFCLTTGISEVQKNVFRVASSDNPMESCDDLRKETFNWTRMFRKSAIKASERDSNHGAGTGFGNVPSA